MFFACFTCIDVPDLLGVFWQSRGCCLVSEVGLGGGGGGWSVYVVCLVRCVWSLWTVWWCDLCGGAVVVGGVWGVGCVPLTLRQTSLSAAQGGGSSLALALWGERQCGFCISACLMYLSRCTLYSSTCMFLCIYLFFIHFLGRSIFPTYFVLQCTFDII